MASAQAPAASALAAGAGCRLRQPRRPAAAATARARASAGQRVVCAAAAAPQRVLVAGATSGGARELIRELVAAGSHVIALARTSASEATLRALGVTHVIVADATSPNALAHVCRRRTTPAAAALQPAARAAAAQQQPVHEHARAARGAAGQAVAGAAPFDSVVSFLGAPPKALCGGPDFDGNRNLVDAAVAAGARRFVLVSALGVGDSLDCIPHASQDVLKPWLSAKERAEQHLQASGLEWVVLRPGPLGDAATAAPAVVSGDAVSSRAYSAMSRTELGRVAARALASPAATNRVLCVLDPGRVVVAAPFMRALEPWEALPFSEVALPA